MILLTLAGCQTQLSLSSLTGGSEGPLAGLRMVGGGGAPEIVKRCSGYTAADKAKGLENWGVDDWRRIDDIDNYKEGLHDAMNLATMQLEAFPADRALVASVPEKYGAFLCAKRERDGRVSPQQEDAYEDAREGVAAFEKQLAAYALTVHKEIDAAMQAATAKMESYASDIAAVRKDYLYLLSTGEVKEKLDLANYYALVVKTAYGAEHQETVKANQRIADGVKQLALLNDKIIVKVVTETQLPEENYQGNERTRLVGLIEEWWMKKFPEDKIAAIILKDSNFGMRKTGSQYNPSTRTSHYFDNSFLRFTVVTADGDQLADMWSLELVKNHADNDAIYTFLTKESGTRAGKLLLSNVKKPKGSQRKG